MSWIRASSPAKAPHASTVLEYQKKPAFYSVLDTLKKETNATPFSKST